MRRSGQHRGSRRAGVSSGGGRGASANASGRASLASQAKSEEPGGVGTKEQPATPDAVLSRTLLDVTPDELTALLAALAVAEPEPEPEPDIDPASQYKQGTDAGAAAPPPPPPNLGQPITQTSYFPTMHSTPSAVPMGPMQPSQMSMPISGAPSRSAAGVDPVRASVGHLLTQACTMPCNTAAQAFAQLVQPTARFQLALDALLPLLDSDRADLAQRILVSYILYALYAPYPLTMNPFRDSMYTTFNRERTASTASSPSSSAVTSNDTIKTISSGSTSTSTLVNPENERDQLVWVLWKILRGDGNDIGPYSPNTLARSPLPAKLRPANLFLDGGESEALAGSPVPPRLGFGGPLQQLPIGTPARSWSSVSPRPPTEEASANKQEDEANAALANAMSLLLAARERILTLSEQRALAPHITVLAAPSNRIITPLDLPPLIAHNPSLAHNLLLAILSSPQSQSPNPSSPSIRPPGQSSNQLPSSGRPGGLSARPNIARSLSLDLANTTPSFLNALTSLPPTLATFDIMGRLLRDPTGLTLRSPFSPRATSSPGTTFSPGSDEGVQRTTVADVVRTETLGPFVHNAVQWLERAEVEEREGRVADDRFAQGVQNLCRFYRSLLKLGILDPVAQETTEMQHFALRYSRFEEARGLYTVLVSGGAA